MLVCYKYYMKIALTFLKELMLIRKGNQKSATFGTTVFFLNKGFKFQTNVFSGCRDLLIMSMNLSDIIIFKH